MIPDFGPEADNAINVALRRLGLPETFGLQAFPGDRFRISRGACYVSQGRVVLYTQRLRNGEWLDFAKGSPEELAASVVFSPLDCR